MIVQKRGIIKPPFSNKLFNKSVISLRSKKGVLSCCCLYLHRYTTEVFHAKTPGLHGYMSHQSGLQYQANGLVSRDCQVSWNHFSSFPQAYRQVVDKNPLIFIDLWVCNILKPSIVNIWISCIWSGQITKKLLQQSHCPKISGNSPVAGPKAKKLEVRFTAKCFQTNDKNIPGPRLIVCYKGLGVWNAPWHRNSYRSNNIHTEF